MRMIITGAGGQVGALLASQAASRGHDVRGFTHSQLDITDAASLRQYISPGDIVFNCAAFTKVDAAESDPEGAYLLNAVAPGNLARACSEVGARLVHLSTDYVFSGDFGGSPPRPYEVGDIPGPLSVYARTKLDGERAVLAAAGDATIVRTALVYTGAAGSDFVAMVVRKAATDETIDAVSDITGSPTFVGDLVASLLGIAETGVRAPVLHVVNAGAASRVELARAIFSELGADPDRVRPISAAALALPAPRPKYSALSLAMSVKAGLTPPRSWRDALAEALTAPLEGGPIPSMP
ncbi:MAG: dTDP-4-dehydrorhamnose reductase [Mycobacterium sp.]